MDGRGQQGRPEEHVQALVPVRGAGEEDDRLAQELLFWSDGAVRLARSDLFPCLKDEVLNVCL